MKTIPTKYDGTLYRSRTEARWAVYFDAAGIKFQYEPEGYQLPSGWYVPDFFVPYWKGFLEVKGREPSEQERRNCLELARASGCEVRLVVGSPIDAEHYLSFWSDMADEDFLREVGNSFVASGPWDGGAIEETKRYRFDWKGENDGAHERISTPHGRKVAVLRRPQRVICPKQRRVITR